MPYMSLTVIWIFSDETDDIRRRRAALVHDEVRVHVRDSRATESRALEPRRLDQPPGGIAFGIPEHAPGARHPKRLRGLATVEAPLHRDAGCRSCRPARARSTVSTMTPRAGKPARPVAPGDLPPRQALQALPRDEERHRLDRPSRIHTPRVPAFIASAPPTVPGMPTANSMPGEPLRERVAHDVREDARRARLDLGAVARSAP